LTPAAEQVVSLAGVVSNSFGEAAESLLPEMSGLHFSESTVQRTAEAAGERLGRLLAAGKTLGFRQPWTWNRDAEGHTCAYLSLDATSVRQQAEDGGRADGRMPYVAMVYNAVPELPDDSPYRPAPSTKTQARYLAGLYDLDELGLQLRRQAGQVGINDAEVWIGLTDGGNGLEHFVRRNFPRDPILILDFWHVTEHLEEFVQVLHPHDETLRRSVMETWCHRLKHAGGQALIDDLDALPLPTRNAAARSQHTALLGYLKNNVHRMDYPHYLAQGWLIGSGAVESACKTVVGQRLKLAGMRWGEPGTDRICHLRALRKSETSQWQAFWQRSVN
jgi:hypothetical protein